jgi:hypothetical protein
VFYDQFIIMFFELQIQNEGYQLQSGPKDALLNALLLAVKRFSSGPPQVHCFSFFYGSAGMWRQF